MSEAPQEIWLVQRDCGYEGHTDVAAVVGQEDAESLKDELNARGRDEYLIEPVRLVTDLATARRERLTIEQSVMPGGKILGDYRELRETVWAPTAPETTQRMLGTLRALEITVTGFDHDEVRERFTALLSEGIERATRMTTR